jgi:peptidoglycan/xylan/chitin deacetylase (PgdA/CDA1 family)
MYFNKTNNFFHGIIFHHFHDNHIHPKGQGTISKNEFVDIINFIGRKYILDADIFFEKFRTKTLKENEVCLTFDDAVKSQIDIALPILEQFKIKSFFFVYSSIFEGKPDNLELFRCFRLNFYRDVNEFYDDFNKYLSLNLEKFFEKNVKKIKTIKENNPFYTIEDIKFRMIRDDYLDKKEYENIIFLMMKEKNFFPSEFKDKIFFSVDDLRKVNDLGHLIGLHSHNHPTLIEKLDYNEQKIEYEKCSLILSKILNKSKNEIKFMAHPCGNYNENTLKILKELGLEMGFRSTMSIDNKMKIKKINSSLFEIARENHSNILKKIK